ncbi:helix-turn-helix domain-containing protein [Nocardia sp. NPDC004711]
MRKTAISLDICDRATWPEFMIPRETSHVTRRSVSSHAQDRMAGTGIPYIKDRGRVLYRKVDVCAYLDAHRVETRAIA